MNSLTSRPRSPIKAIDVDVGGGVAGHHAQQHALADSGAGENAHPLPLAACEQSVDRADAGSQRCVDPWPLDRRRRGAIQRDAAPPRVQAAVDRPPMGIDHAAEQSVADSQPTRSPDQSHAIATPHAV